MLCFKKLTSSVKSIHTTKPAKDFVCSFVHSCHSENTEYLFSIRVNCAPEKHWYPSWTIAPNLWEMSKSATVIEEILLQWLPSEGSLVSLCISYSEVSWAASTVVVFVQGDIGARIRLLTSHQAGSSTGDLMTLTYHLWFSPGEFSV